MPTADDPDIKIEYGDTTFPPSSWTELQDYAASFKIRDAGVLAVPSINLFLHNFQGRFTDNQNSLYLKNYGIIRVRVDVGNGLDTLFYGRIYGKRDPISGAYYKGGFGAGFGSGFQVGTGGLRSTVELFCKDIGAQKLLDQTKTFPEGMGYASWKNTCKEAIEDFLVNPDSEIDTGITLETDNGLITTTEFPRDPNQDSLLDLLRLVADAINYDGYVYVNTSNQLKLYFKQAGTEETNPVITLRDPFKEVEPNYDLDEIGNIIFVWGGTDQGYPVDGDSAFTENSGNWTPWKGTETITKNCTETPQIGTYCTKITLPSGTADKGAFINFDSNFDCNLRFNSLVFYGKHNFIDGQFYIRIYDTDGNALSRTSTQESWLYYSFPLGQNASDWYQVIGSTFNWVLTKILFWMPISLWSFSIWIDGLQVHGGLKIDPIAYPTLNPKIQDLTGGTISEPRVYHHVDDKINSFEQAQTIGQYVLAVKKNLIRKVSATKSAYTWAKPHQYLRLYLPEHNIAYTEKYRILEQQQDWKTENKVLRTTFTLIKRSDIFDSKAIQMSELAGLLKKIGEG